MKNVNSLLVGCSQSVNNAGWLSGAVVVYRIKLENEVLEVEGIDKDKKTIKEYKINIKDIKHIGKESDDIFYIDSNIKKISMHVVDDNRGKVIELFNILKEYNIDDNSEKRKKRNKTFLYIYWAIIMALGIMILILNI